MLPSLTYSVLDSSQRFLAGIHSYSSPQIQMQIIKSCATNAPRSSVIINFSQMLTYNLQFFLICLKIAEISQLHAARKLAASVAISTRAPAKARRTGTSLPECKYSVVCSDAPLLDRLLAVDLCALAVPVSRVPIVFFWGVCAIVLLLPTER